MAEQQDQESRIERIEYDADPERCQALTHQGQRQCINKGAILKDGSRAVYCRIHGGPGTQRAIEQDQTSNYLLTKWQNHLERQARSPNIKSLRDEIGILRMSLEIIINQCHTESDLVMQSQKISDMVVKVNKLVSNCHRIEGAMGELLDKKAIIQFANVIIGILTEEINDVDLLTRVADRIMRSVVSINAQPDAGTEGEDFGGSPS